MNRNVRLPLCWLIVMHTVLVVEDDPALRALMVRTLSAKGYRALEASDGIEALERLAADPDIELVVTDIVMPRMNGVELAQQLAASARTRLLFVSAFGKEYSELPASLLEKPFSQAALIAQVERLLEVPTTSE
jgi:two-component system, cell cycle sensor histidine kinase and response regulator CckA